MKQDKGKLSPEMEDFLVTIRRAVLSAAGVKGVKFSDEEQVKIIWGVGGGKGGGVYRIMEEK